MTTKSTSESKTQVVGNCYFVGMHMVCCHGPITAVRRVKVAEKTIWRGDLKESSTFRVEARWSGEGGIGCYVDAEFGEHDQDQNPYLADVLGIDEVPAYRGVVSFILNQAYVGNTSYVKPWSFLLERTKTFDSWYPEKAAIRYYPGKRNKFLYYGVRRTEKGHGRPTVQMSGNKIYCAWIGSNPYDEEGNFYLTHTRPKLHEDYQVWMAEMDLKGNNWKMKKVTTGRPKRVSMYQEYVRFTINQNVMYFLWHTRHYGIFVGGQGGGVYTAKIDVDHENGIKYLSLDSAARQRTNFPGYKNTEGRKWYSSHQRLNKATLAVHKGVDAYSAIGLSFAVGMNSAQFVLLSHGCTCSRSWCFDVFANKSSSYIWNDGPDCEGNIWGFSSFAGCDCFYDVNPCSQAIRTRESGVHMLQPQIDVFETGDGFTPTVRYFAYIHHKVWPPNWQNGQMMRYPDKIRYGIQYEGSWEEVYIEHTWHGKIRSNGHGIGINNLNFVIDHDEHGTCQIDCKRV